MGAAAFNHRHRNTIKHNSAVELVNRSFSRGLVQKRAGQRDRREVLLAITARGRRLLERLAVRHRTELRSVAPTLMSAIAALGKDAS